MMREPRMVDHSTTQLIRTLGLKDQRDSVNFSNIFLVYYRSEGLAISILN